MKTLELRDFSLVLALALMGAFFTWQTNGIFLSPGHVAEMGVEMATLGTAALGMLLIILLGHIDLSVGSSLALTGTLTVILINWMGWPAPLAMAAGLGLGVLLYFLMGLLVAKENIPAFIITLGGLMLFRGLSWSLTGSTTVSAEIGGQMNTLSALNRFSLPSWGVLAWALLALIFATLVWGQLQHRKRQRSQMPEHHDTEVSLLKGFVLFQVVLLLFIMLNRHEGIPLALLVLGALAGFIYVLTQHTRFGRYLYAIGGNVEAARLSGVPVRSVTLGAFVLAGVTASVTGFLNAAYVRSVSTTTGNLMELDAIAACVIGGTRLSGGKGSVLGVLFGALIITFLIKGMKLMGVGPETEYMARGIVLTLAVWMDVRVNRRVA